MKNISVPKYSWHVPCRKIDVDSALDSQQRKRKPLTKKTEQRAQKKKPLSTSHDKPIIHINRLVPITCTIQFPTVELYGERLCNTSIRKAFG